MKPEILKKILSVVELVAVAIIIFGLVFKLMQLSGTDLLLMIGLMTLATAHFLFAYIPVQTTENPGVKKGFAELLVTILPKYLFIGLAVYWIAVLFTSLHYPGANEMMLIGLLSIVSGSLLSMILILVNRGRMKILQAPLIRVAATLVIYFALLFFKQ